MISGLIFGLGLVLLLLVLGAAPFTSVVPFAAILTATAATGLAIGLYTPTRRQR
jgi:hypothetical protein